MTLKTPIRPLSGFCNEFLLASKYALNHQVKRGQVPSELEDCWRGRINGRLFFDKTFKVSALNRQSVEQII
jgi:hypothetical protein